MIKKRYSNMDAVEKKISWKELRQWRKERRRKQKDLSFVVPSAESVDTDFLRRNRTETCIVWIGHSTFLIQYKGLNIITDPVWANRMGLEKRLSAPGIPIGEMPEIDVVLISHSHYDHLDFPSVRKLKGNPVYAVPAGLGGKFEAKRLKGAVEFEWWETRTVGTVEFAFVPAQHWTRRTLHDTNTSHWGGWVIRDAGDREPFAPCIYFAGDSGYFRGFREIGRRFSVDVALMPIGAYEPEWFMSMQHVSPEEAVQAFMDVGAHLFIPMHYGAFRLADDTPKEALDRLHAAWRNRGLDPARLRVLKLGEIFFPQPSLTPAARR